jgi:hypothetical protein
MGSAAHQQGDKKFWGLRALLLIIDIEAAAVPTWSVLFARNKINLRRVFYIITQKAQDLCVETLCVATAKLWRAIFECIQQKLTRRRTHMRTRYILQREILSALKGAARENLRALLSHPL